MSPSRTPTLESDRPTIIRRGAAGMAMLLLLLGGCSTPRASVEPEQARWWRGNLHTHSLWSDGDDFPEMITDWYRRQGYDFLAISDHNTLAEGDRWVEAGGPARRDHYRRYVERFGREWVEERGAGDSMRVRLKPLSEYRRLFEEPGRFLLIQSEEISDRLGEKPLHVNATNIVERIEPQGGGSVREVLQRNIDAVLAQRERTGQPMFPHLNHPNFVWAVTVEDMMALEGERFFEVYNGHPLVNNEGDAVHPGAERMWDIVLAHRLSHGEPVMFGLATDDAHNYHQFQAKNSNPGRGWVMVRAPALTTEAIIEALERGDFYATSGVRLRDVRRAGRRVQIEIEPEAGVTYTTRFVGTRRGYDPRSSPATDPAGNPVSGRYSADIGVLLAEVPGTSPSYETRGDELYVRAKIVSSKPKVNGYREDEVETAWTQPFVPGAGRSP